ncbi:hypothetical protein [Burkholderia sp. BDU5]|uniref:hypothetical protein n=1 Tax=Burkholderia sp. BDU5 TaxID=1385590 RepID=UPI000A4BCA6A|nr:hypothetical protein [Burkholderia sp. BDU5]
MKPVDFFHDLRQSGLRLDRPLMLIEPRDAAEQINRGNPNAVSQVFLQASFELAVFQSDRVHGDPP